MKYTVLLFFLTASAALAERFDVRAHVEPEQVAIGQSFDLVVEVERDEGERIAVPEQVPSSDEVRLARRPTRKSTLVAGRVHEVIRFTFLALDLDEVETPELILHTPEGRALTIAPVTVSVIDDVNEAGERNAAPDPEAAPDFAWYGESDHRPFYAGGLLLLLLFAGLAIRRIRQQTRSRMPAAPPAEVVPLQTQALARLDALLAKKLVERGQIGAFVPLLMDDVLRFYLDRRYAIPAERSTTRELMQQLADGEVLGEERAHIESILDNADLVKFAKANLQGSVAEKMAEDVRALINKTAEQP